MKMRLGRYLLICSLPYIIIVAAASEATEEASKSDKKGCVMKDGIESCTRSDIPKSRKKRVVTLPNLTSLSLQSRLTVPQNPVGQYLVWARARFLVRTMFTESTIAAAGTNPLAAGLGRSFSTNEDFNNLLKRTIVDDQIDILEKIENALDKGGFPGKQCVLRAICELAETPIHHWSIVGEMINTLLRPKKASHVSLEEYKRAEKIGEEQGDCWSFYPECVISVFNIIPDIYTTDDHVEVSFNGFDAGSKYKETGAMNEDLVNMVKDEMIKDKMKIIKEHHVDLDFTSK